MENKRKPYSTDLSDAEWELIAPLLPPPAKVGLPREHDMREIVNAIYYVLGNGIKWENMPHDLPPAGTVYYWFAKFRNFGVIEQAHQQLHRQVRELSGREPEPSAIIIDSQTVKTTEKGGDVATTLLRRPAVVSGKSW